MTKTYLSDHDGPCSGSDYIEGLAVEPEVLELWKEVGSSITEARRMIRELWLLTEASRLLDKQERFWRRNMLKRIEKLEGKDSA